MALSPRARVVLVAAISSALAFALGMFAGRAGQSGLPRSTRSAEGPKAAAFSGGGISRAELEQRIAEMSPFARARYQTLEQKREYVEGLARFELLAREAESRG